MNFEDAVQTLRAGAEWSDLGQAIGVVIASPSANAWDLVLGLKYGGVIAEQAAFALYKKTNRQTPEDPSRIAVDLQSWVSWLLNSESSDADTTIARIYQVQGNIVTRDEIQKIIGKYLTRRERLVLVLHYFEEMTFAEIAQALGENEEAIRSVRNEILERIRSRINPDVKPLSNLFRDLVA